MIRGLSRKENAQVSKIHFAVGVEVVARVVVSEVSDNPEVDVGEVYGAIIIEVERRFGFWTDGVRYAVLDGEEDGSFSVVCGEEGFGKFHIGFSGFFSYESDVENLSCLYESAGADSTAAPL